jgi:hypothetical protein
MRKTSKAHPGYEQLFKVPHHMPISVINDDVDDAASI